MFVVRLCPIIGFKINYPYPYLCPWLSLLRRHSSWWTCPSSPDDFPEPFLSHLFVAEVPSHHSQGLSPSYLSTCVTLSTSSTSLSICWSTLHTPSSLLISALCLRQSEFLLCLHHGPSTAMVLRRNFLVSSCISPGTGQSSPLVSWSYYWYLPTSRTQSSF